MIMCLCRMKIDFDQLKALQYCDNDQCMHYNQIGIGNICILSRKNNQVYCNACKNRWVLTKDTFFYDLKSKKVRIISVLKDLSQRTTGHSAYQWRELNHAKTMVAASSRTHDSNQ